MNNMRTVEIAKEVYKSGTASEFLGVESTKVGTIDDAGSQNNTESVPRYGEHSRGFEIG